MMQADGYIPQSNDAHRRIVAALEQRNGPAVRVSLEQDIAVAAAVLSENLRMTA